VKGSTNHKLTLAMFTALVSSPKMSDPIRQRLFFSFKKVLTPRSLIKKQREDLAKFHRRNNPDEDDEPLMSIEED